MITLSSSQAHKPLGARGFTILLVGVILGFPLGMHVLAHFVA